MIKKLATICLIFMAGCSATDRTDVPVSLEKAKSIVPIPLPISATNIFYYTHADGMQEWEFLLRFDCAADDLDSWVESTIKSNNATYGASYPYDRVPIGSTAKAAIPSGDVPGFPWWTTSSIATGYYRGEIESHAVRIWVDTDRQRVYLNQTD